MAAAAATVTRVHVPFGLAGSVVWQQQMPWLREDLEKIQQMIRGFFRAYDPAWSDVCLLLETVFSPEEQVLILQKNRERAAAPDGRTVWPDAAPDRNYQTKAGLNA